MEQELYDKLTTRYIRDLQKTKMDPFERATILREYMQEHKMSIRGLAKEYGINKSTVEDWLLWNKLPETNYEELIQSGVTHTEIYRELRKKKIQEIPEINETTIILGRVIKEIKSLKKNSEYNQETITLIHALRNELNILEMTIEQKEKRPFYDRNQKHEYKQ